MESATSPSSRSAVQPARAGRSRARVTTTRVVNAAALDFLKPQFAGKLVTAYPADDDATLYAFDTIVKKFDTIVKKYGWGYMKKYMAQKTNFIQGHLGELRSIADGTNAVTFDSTSSTTGALKKAGQPIEFAFPASDTMPTFFVTAGIFKDAPHPDAAKLFLDWYMAKDQQSQIGTYSARTDVEPPPGLKPLSAYRIATGYQQFVSDEKNLVALRKRFESYTGPVVNRGGGAAARHQRNCRDQNKPQGDIDRIHGQAPSRLQRFARSARQRCALITRFLNGSPPKACALSLNSPEIEFAGDRLVLADSSSAMLNEDVDVSNKCPTVIPDTAAPPPRARTPRRIGGGSDTRCDSLKTAGTRHDRCPRRAGYADGGRGSAIVFQEATGAEASAGPDPTQLHQSTAAHPWRSLRLGVRERRSRELKVRVDGQITFNTTAQMLSAALSGYGLTYVPEGLVEPHVAKGRLKRVLGDYVDYNG